MTAEKTPGTSVIGVDLGGTTVSVGRVSDGGVEERLTRSISGGGSEEEVLEEVLGAIGAVFDERVAGIGCGVPSVVDVETGIVYDVENIASWRRVPLKARIEARFGVPAAINNDANVFALGEHRYGRGRDFENMVGITLGTGMGTGVVLDGRLIMGGNCGAGEIGSIPYKGLTVEDFCAGRFFRREAGVPGDVLYERARNGDHDARVWFHRFGAEFSFAIVVVLYAYDPEAILLGGSISRAFDLFESSMRQGLEGFDYPHIVERLVIEPSTLADAALLGAAALLPR